MTSQPPSAPTTDATPRWRQIAHHLAAAIGPGGWQPGDRLPSEAQLAARFAVNRHTIRRAVEHLVRTGLLRTEQGRGSFVADEMLDYAVTGRTRFSEWIRRHNREPGGQLLHLTERPATAPVAAALQIPPGEPVLIMERLGLADSTPISIATHHFPTRRLPGLAAALRTHPTITAALAAAGIPDYTRQSTRTSARLPTAVEAGLLQIPRTQPILVCENLNITPTGDTVELGITRHPANRVQLVFEP